MNCMEQTHQDEEHNDNVGPEEEMHSPRNRRVSKLHAHHTSQYICICM